MNEESNRAKCCRCGYENYSNLLVFVHKEESFYCPTCYLKREGSTNYFKGMSNEEALKLILSGQVWKKKDQTKSI